MMLLWWNFNHWLHWKLSKWQLPVQPGIKISSKWYIDFSVILKHCFCRNNYLSTPSSLCWFSFPDSKGHGANMGPTWVLSAPDGPHVGPTNLTIWVYKRGPCWWGFETSVTSVASITCASSGVYVHLEKNPTAAAKNSTPTAENRWREEKKHWRSALAGIPPRLWKDGPISVAIAHVKYWIVWRSWLKNRTPCTNVSDL